MEQFRILATPASACIGGDYGNRESNQDYVGVAERIPGGRRGGIAAGHEEFARSDGFEVASLKGKVENGKITEYRVTMEVTFVLE